MAAGVTSLSMNKCRRTCGYLKRVLKALLLLGLCGWTYYLSYSIPRGSMPEVEPITTNTTDQHVTLTHETLSPKAEAEQEIVDMTEESCDAQAVSSSPPSEVKPNTVQETEESCGLKMISGFPESEFATEAVKVTEEIFDLQATTKFSPCEVSPQIIQEVKENCDLQINLESPENEFATEPVKTTENCDLAETCTYKSTSDVVQLTEENFYSLVMSSSGPWLVEFYAPWCPHCIKFTYDYANVAARLRGVFNVGKIDGVEERNLTKQYGVNSFPRFFFFIGNKTSPILYSGPRTADYMVKTALNWISWGTAMYYH